MTEAAEAVVLDEILVVQGSHEKSLMQFAQTAVLLVRFLSSQLLTSLSTVENVTASEDPHGTLTGLLHKKRVLLLIS